MRALSHYWLLPTIGFLAVGLTGCTTAPGTSPFAQSPAKPTAEEIAQFDYGPRPSDKEAELRAFFQTTLKDPESARYRFLPVKQYWCQEDRYMGGKRYIGWLVPVGVNAKNSYGGYTGEQLYGFMYKDDKLVKMILPDSWQYLTTP